jgi:hypothetical protein
MLWNIEKRINECVSYSVFYLNIKESSDTKRDNGTSFGNQ